MNGTILQLIGLTTYGDVFLRTGLMPPDFYPEHVIYRFCNQVDFREYKKSFYEKETSELILNKDPIEWYADLWENDCKKMSLYLDLADNSTVNQDHKLAGLVGGGGNWMIETIFADYSYYWSNRWEVNAPDDRNDNIWTVSYGRKDKRFPITNLQIDQIETKKSLDKILLEIGNFAARHALDNWTEIFQSAREMLNEEKADNSFNLFPTQHYSVLSRQLMNAASAAWVYGGMGSWNDQGFESDEDSKLYERLSAQLYANVQVAIISAVNSNK
ncbi:MAG: hypothetical protein ABIV51_08740 [Saprospiraceae bacterium]